MFIRILTSALFAGVAAGLIAALLQLVFVQPVLLHAELYESGQLAHFDAAGAASVNPDLPEFDLLRDGLSILFSMLIYAGYALILIALMVLAEDRGARIDARHGLIWGIAGFVAFQLAPGFSLPPEVPGVAAADIDARIWWWLATVLATGLALWLIAFGHGVAAWGAAALLILAPHLIGAPQPEIFAGSVPPELAGLFAARAFGLGLMAWGLLGALAGFFWQREGLRQGLNQAA